MSTIIPPSAGTQKETGTVVQNTAGKTMFFGFLGSRGKNLAANEIYTHPGDLFQYVASKRAANRWRYYLEIALETGLLSILSTPAVILYDPILAKPLQLEASNGVLGYSDPFSLPNPNSTFVAA